MIRKRLSRSLRDWLAVDANSLNTVEQVRTIGDYETALSIERRLPDSWRVERDIVQFETEPLAEVLRLTGSDGYRITLKPVDLQAPTDAIELYTRRSPFDARTRRDTFDSLSAAVQAATELASTRQETSRSSASRSTVRASTGTLHLYET